MGETSVVDRPRGEMSGSLDRVHLSSICLSVCLCLCMSASIDSDLSVSFFQSVSMSLCLCICTDSIHVS